MSRLLKIIPLTCTLTLEGQYPLFSNLNSPGAAAMVDSFMASQGAQWLQNLPASAGDTRDTCSIPGPGR